MLKSKILIFAAVCFFGIALFAYAADAVPSLRQSRELSSCKSELDSKLQIECIFTTITKELKRGGVVPAMDTFLRAYQEFPSFVQSGCHNQAHRVGDMVYYGFYVTGSQKLDDIEFPQLTTACGYGMYHGFLEHLIQDHPDIGFVTKTCDYLTSRLGAQMRDIEPICYHGSGHGFTLARGELVPPKNAGDVAAYTELPVKQCESLPHATEELKTECKEGVFNVLIQWMLHKENGFHYDTDNPFSACTGVALSSREACYFEMAQQTDVLAEEDPRELANIAEKVQDTKYQMAAFRVGVTNITRSVILEEDKLGVVFDQCSQLNKVYFDQCVRSIIHGLFEHGEPQHEYVKALTFCSNQYIESKGQSSNCFGRIPASLRRFYTVDKALGVCEEFPAQYQADCRKTVST